MKIAFVVLGNLPRKSNSRRLFRKRNTGRPIIVKSENALAYENSFLSQTQKVKKGAFQEKEFLKLTLHIYYQSWRSDLSDELFCDLLQKSQIIPNDRYIVEKHLYHHIDTENPRVEAEITVDRK